MLYIYPDNPLHFIILSFIFKLIIRDSNFTDSLGVLECKDRPHTPMNEQEQEGDVLWCEEVQITTRRLRNMMRILIVLWIVMEQ